MDLPGFDGVSYCHNSWSLVLLNIQPNVKRGLQASSLKCLGLAAGEELHRHRIPDVTQLAWNPLEMGSRSKGNLDFHRCWKATIFPTSQIIVSMLEEADCQSSHIGSRDITPVSVGKPTSNCCDTPLFFFSRNCYCKSNTLLPATPYFPPLRTFKNYDIFNIAIRKYITVEYCQH